ncbi:hypothetical protein [Planococcus alpniumensis]|uniref:hypothetical protein n=1 Tax=Planococcus alpniumensis TaxID=2708345 RepID=UPI001B8B535E|nr:hypothetical protein [Planococcus sp. MSAK28401]
MDSDSGRKEKNINNPYLSLSIGAIGMLLLTFGIFELVLNNIGMNPAEFLLPCAGLIILVHYIYYLERKAGISNKLIWIRALALMTVLAVGAYIAY